MEVYEPQMSTIPSQDLFPSSGVSDAISGSLPTDLETGSGDYAEIPENSGERELTSSNLEMSQVPENSGEREVSSSNMEGVNLEPYVGQEYKSEQEAKAFYNGYARQTGFSIRKGPLYRSSRDRAVTSRIFVCSKEGFRRETSDVNEKGNLKRRMAVTRVGCKAQMWVKKQPSGMWVVKQFQREHNHELTPMKPHLLRSHKNMLDNVKEYVETLKGVGVDTTKIQSLFVEEARAIGKIGDAEKDTESEDKKKIHELTVELHRERRRSASYRQQLEMVLKDIEDHAYHLSKQVEDIVGNVKEIESLESIYERSKEDLCSKRQTRCSDNFLGGSVLYPSSTSLFTTPCEFSDMGEQKKVFDEQLNERLDQILLLLKKTLASSVENFTFVLDGHLQTCSGEFFLAKKAMELL